MFNDVTPFFRSHNRGIKDVGKGIGEKVKGDWAGGCHKPRMVQW